MYCSDTCYLQHKSHRTFCRKSSTSSETDTSLLEMCTDIILKAVEVCGDFQSFYDLFENGSKGRTIDEYEESSKLGFINIIGSLAISDDSTKVIPEEMKTLFEIAPFNKFWSTREELDDVIDCFQRIMGILNTNLLELGEHQLEDESWNVESVGGGLCPFGSLFNHSCNPNISRFTFDNQIVFYAARPIKKDEQLFISYGYDFALVDIIERQKGLANYSFACDCEACKEDYPGIENLERKIEEFIPLTFGSYDSKTAIKVFMENCKFIEEHATFYPCFEIIYSLFHNVHLTYQISRSVF